VVTQIEQTCMEIGHQLSPQSKRDARAIGVQRIDLVRVMVLDELHFLPTGICGNSFYKLPSAATKELRSATALFSKLAFTIAG
jgi:hypothetical protein